MTRGKRNAPNCANRERGPGRARARARRRLLRHQPGPRVGGRARPFRQPAQRLLAPAPRRRLHAAAARAERAVRAARLRRRRRRTPPPARRRGRATCAAPTSRFGRPPQAYRPRAPAARDRVRRQGGVPRRVRHARRARPAGANDRRRRLFVLPSTSPANAAVPYADRLHWFRALTDWLEPVERSAVRALVLDEERRTLLVEFRDDEGQVWWATPGGGIEEGEDVEAALRRELAEELGLDGFDARPRALDARAHVRLARHDPPPARAHLARRDRTDTSRRRASTSLRSASSTFAGGRSTSWTAATETLVPERLPQLLRDLRENGPPAEPFDVGV